MSAPVDELVRRFYAEIWEQGREATAPDILTEDFVFRGSLGSDRRGVAAFLDYVRAVRAGLSDYRCRIDSLVIEPPRAAAEMTFSGVHHGSFFGVEPTGRMIEWRGAAFFTAAGGRLARLWVLGDTDAVRRQLGAEISVR